MAAPAVPAVNPINVKAINPTVIVTRIHALEAQGLVYLHLWGPQVFAICLAAAAIAFLLGFLGGAKGLRRFGLVLAFGSAVLYFGGFWILKMLLHFKAPGA